MPSDSIEALTLEELSRLKVRVAQLEAAAVIKPTDPTTALADFREGDRVTIRNKIKRLANWRTVWGQEAAQRATVTHLYRDQEVHFRTRNGVNTWRARNNLKCHEQPNSL